MNKDDIDRRAMNAESLLNNDLFNETFSQLRDYYVKKWELSEDSDTKSREVFYNRLKAIQEVKREFIRALDAKKLTD